MHVEFVRFPTSVVLFHLYDRLQQRYLAPAPLRLPPSIIIIVGKPCIYTRTWSVAVWTSIVNCRTRSFIAEHFSDTDLV